MSYFYRNPNICIDDIRHGFYMCPKCQSQKPVRIITKNENIVIKRSTYFYPAYKAKCMDCGSEDSYA